MSKNKKKAKKISEEEYLGLFSKNKKNLKICVIWL